MNTNVGCQIIFSEGKLMIRNFLKQGWGGCLPVKFLDVNFKVLSYFIRGGENFSKKKEKMGSSGKILKDTTVLFLFFFIRGVVGG